ncbi:MAG: hypothetical protein IJ229_12325 [Clostridia bacterium]|nr:hypothetical protein [Clostridia bacterium]MBR1684662.1 hypothetical protein [Clostridia bacterium]MBR2288484.1 hypothetical protein [Clostridia bacterium]
MRKCFVLLLVLLALTTFAQAESPALPIYPLLDGEEIIGSAVLFAADTTLLTTAPIAHPDGEISILVSEVPLRVEVYNEPDSLLSLLLTEEPLAAAPFSLGVLLGDAHYAGYTRDLTLIEGACDQIAQTLYPEGITLAAGAGLLPGAALIDGTGALTGLIAADLGEGRNRYYALSSAELYEQLTKLTESPAETPAGFLPSTASVSGHIVSLAWEDDAASETEPTYCVYWYDVENSFYSYFPLSATECTVHCVPGRSYRFFVRRITEGDVQSVPYLPPEFETFITLDAPEKATDYDFLDTDVHIAWYAKDAQQSLTENLPAYTDFASIFTHENVEIALQVTSTYVVEEEITCDLTCALYAPDGTCYSSLSGFIYGPEYMAEDVWHMDITSLLDECSAAGSATPGTYYVRYFLDDKLASEVSFVVP